MGDKGLCECPAAIRTLSCVCLFMERHKTVHLWFRTPIHKSNTIMKHRSAFSNTSCVPRECLFVLMADAQRLGLVPEKATSRRPPLYCLGDGDNEWQIWHWLLGLAACHSEPHLGQGKATGQTWDSGHLCLLKYFIQQQLSCFLAYIPN